MLDPSVIKNTAISSCHPALGLMLASKKWSNILPIVVLDSRGDQPNIAADEIAAGILPTRRTFFIGVGQGVNKP
jgi:hypothetical protein